MLVKRLISFDKRVSSLWIGPRQSGKSTLITAALENEKVFTLNLLEIDLYRRYLSHPGQFKKDVEYQINQQQVEFIFIDEIQKIPELTNEVHFLIEKYKAKRIKFILSGSSARKLKRGNANLLAGRAVLKKLFPLLSLELRADFSLETCLQYGSLAGIYFEPRDLKIQKLKTYVETYLKEEVAQEGLVRNFDFFNRFFDVAAIYSAELINYSNIARECAVSVKTAQNYFSILEETLLSFELPAWDKSLKRQLSKHSKFYFCDNGILNAINQNLNDPLHPTIRGKMFEQWFMNEVRAILSYASLELSMHFWRTERGEYEVDLILSKSHAAQMAIEIKAKQKISPGDLISLKKFHDEFPKTKLYCVYEGDHGYFEDGVEIIPYYELLKQLAAKILD